MEDKSLRVLIETTLNKLLANTERAFGTDREDDSSLMRIVNIGIVPLTNGIQVKCKVHNSQEQSNHDTAIYFENIDVGGEGEYDVEIMATTGNIISVQKQQLENADVKVRCTCLDFYWRFAMWNFSDGSLLGKKPSPYVKKTNRQPNNPMRLPGMCKHLIATTDHFEDLMRK